ncbi:N-acetylmannosaminyltransferase [Paenibacillus sp. 32O-W]|jgi:N-acetylglucosaminyldiphosphoundecaprenol N-acetyl-beta-D-mannosaminyltransferase|uniref:N-acetylglucosaminyldiphosphoundecaprenol N-acetyl-beta-D-mannosaminyltransferase n=2 Tax=Paenibacillus TaxID=44249 RepID=A0ABQ4N768_9BACL|nr:N-acetylmannosaminyltransferase [Paenibacillus sp. 32O-W]GIQ64017.1 acetylglucosaminyldiphosphoundecaprenol acetyl-beta-D-mannosaminyltransferase [Paenibacillus cisolokensis]
MTTRTVEQPADAGGKERLPASGGSPGEGGLPAVPTVPIYGIPFSRMNMEDTLRYMTDAIERKRPIQVITANPIMVMAALDNPAYYKMMLEAELIVPDGAGIVWAASYVGQPVAERVAGFDLMHRLMEIGNRRGWSVYLLGTTQETIEAAAVNFRDRYPNVKIAGFRNGFFGPEEDADVVKAIRNAKPDLLFVARSTDTQDPWIAKYKHELGATLMMGVGGSFDIVAGKLKRAPVLFQKLRLEWFYRLLQEPKRYKRMLVLPKFALKVIRDKENVTKGRPTLP